MKKILIILSAVLLLTTGYTTQAMTITDDPDMYNDNYLKNINIEHLWNFDGDFGFKGNGVKVAVIDEGFYKGHSDFDQQKITVYDCKTTNTCITTAENLVSGHKTHGTNVSGIIIAKHDGIEIDGVAPGVELEFHNADLTTHETTRESLPRVLNFIYEKNQTLNRKDQVKVINLSLSVINTEESKLAIDTAIERLVSQGVLIIGVAGNNGSNKVGYNYQPNAQYTTQDPDDSTITDKKMYYADWNSTFFGYEEAIADPKYGVEYPGSNPNVMAVAAIDTGNNRAKYISDDLDADSPWSQTGPDVEIAAFGKDVKLAWHGGKSYDTDSGTSIAAPFVTGVAALLFEMYPDATGQEIREKLIDNASYTANYGDVYHPETKSTSTNTDHNWEYGYGFLLANVQQQLIKNIEDTEGSGMRNLYTIGDIKTYYPYPSLSADSYHLEGENKISKTQYYWNDWVQVAQNKWFIPSSEEIGADYTVFSTSDLYDAPYGNVVPDTKIEPGDVKVYKQYGDDYYGFYQLGSDYNNYWVRGQTGKLGKEVPYETTLTTYKYEYLYSFPSTRFNTWVAINENQQVTTLSRFIDGEGIWWFKVVKDGQVGWIMGDKGGYFTIENINKTMYLREGIRYRETPDQNKPVISTLTEPSVEVTGRYIDYLNDFTWYRVNIESQDYWIIGEEGLYAIEPTDVETYKTAWWLSQTLFQHPFSETTYELGTIPYYEDVQVNGMWEDDDYIWYNVTSSIGTGWIRSNYND
ncbi:S8 family serine peptidase [Bacillus sp. ISL-39]|uniref:S8 family peptidase n=1 Tax=Bacillus sp. ISL-39 TaxID=2819124 RepID=UPI001BE9C97D|nr:S8 family serine peptidase [Bacillus sp. ISL-39]MBT2636437.1 S8 family serine peptidase [Bacillus sp. ISL-39]